MTKTIFHYENCQEPNLKITKRGVGNNSWEFKCVTCTKGTAVMHSASLNSDDLKIFQDTIK